MDPEFLRESGPLEERLSAALAKLALVGRASLGRAAQAEGLSPLQALILERLRRGPASVGELARLLGVTPPTVSDSVDSLERKGLVARRPAGQGRRVEISATSRGKKLLRQPLSWAEVFSEAVTACSEAEKAVLLGLLLRLIARLVERGVIAEARLCITCRYFRAYAHADGAHPHHCALLDRPLAEAHLRVDCPDQEPLPRQTVRRRLEVLQQGGAG